MTQDLPSVHTIGRLSQYRGLLAAALRDGMVNIYSRQLAALADSSPSQVRRDLMYVGCAGSPAHGYDVRELVDSIGRYLDAPEHEDVALVGIGNLGRAIMAFFASRRPNLAIGAAFDTDEYKVNRVIHGVRCYAMSELPRIMRERNIRVGIITVPSEAAQRVADALISAGVRGILNFAPITLKVPHGVYVERRDMTTSLEKAAFFARRSKR